LEVVHGARVIDVGVGVDDVLRHEPVPGEQRLEARRLVPRLDQDGLPGGGIAHDVGTLLEGADRGPGDAEAAQAENELPQPQVALAFGLLNLTPAPWSVSTKSITVPSRKGMLCRSTATWMPPHS